MASLQPGTEIGGFRIEGVLGRGGMGTVYSAVRARLDQRVALKVLNPDRADEEDFRQRFVREAQLASGLNHPNIIPVYDAGEDEGLLYLAMRRVEGPGLDEIIAEEAPLDPGRTIALLAQVASALDAAHRNGLIHRDVKPENILVTSGGATEYGEHVYLSDFGISKLMGAAGPTLTGQLVGTWGYLAPELIEGKPTDGRCDQYALGCVFYRCLTGVLPFDRDTDAQLLMAHLRDPVPRISASRPELGGQLDRVITRMLAKQPGDRYSSCAEAIAAARAAVAPVVRERKKRAASMTSVRTRGIAAVVAALLIAALVAGVAALALSGDEQDGNGNTARPPGASLKKAVGTAKALKVVQLEVASPDRYVEPTTTPRPPPSVPPPPPPSVPPPPPPSPGTECPPVCPNFP